MQYCQKLEAIYYEDFPFNVRYQSTFGCFLLVLFILICLKCFQAYFEISIYVKHNSDEYKKISVERNETLTMQIS